MALSLEVKKFINSEHVGKYVDIFLPIESMPEHPAKKKKAAQDPISVPQRDADGSDEGQSPVQSMEAEDVGKEEYQIEPSYERINLHYMEEGDGEPMILVHTIGQSLFTWRSIFHSLAQNYRVIAVDLPGHGYSSRPQEYSYTIEEQSHILELFMDAVEIESAHFMGFSMGGAYVMDLCMRHPERVGRVILLSPGGISPEMPTSVKLLDSGIFGGIASILFGMRTVENILSECFFDQTVGVKDDVVQEYYKTVCDSASRRALRMSLHNFDDHLVISRLRTMEMPVLILLGSEDKWRFPNHVEIYHAAIPSAGYSLVRNAGHLLHEEKPDKVMAAVLEFIPVVAPDVD